MKNMKTDMDSQDAVNNAEAAKAVAESELFAANQLNLDMEDAL